MLGGGGLIFRIHWQQPLALAALTLGYACFAAGLMAVLVALMPDERRAGALNTIAGMALGLAGGCAFPPQHSRRSCASTSRHCCRAYWFADTARNLEFGGAKSPWMSGDAETRRPERGADRRWPRSCSAGDSARGCAHETHSRHRPQRPAPLSQEQERLRVAVRRAAGVRLFHGLRQSRPGDPSNRKPPVLIENQDTNFLGRVFLDELGAQGHVAA